MNTLFRKRSPEKRNGNIELGAVIIVAAMIAAALAHRLHEGRV
jgi:hypothetical protein